jgi:hypothetical protein
LILLLERFKIKLWVFDLIDEESLKIANRDGTIRLDSLALLLAGMRTGIGKNSWKRKRLPYQPVGLFELALRNESHIPLSIAMERTGGCAWRCPFPVDGIFERDRLRKRDIDGLSLSKPHIKFIRKGDRALGHTVCTGCAFVDIHIAGFLPEDHLEMSGFPFDMEHLGIGEEVDVGMVRRIDHLGRDDASRAIQGGKGLVQLSHVAANRKVLLHQMDLKPFFSNVEGRLHPGNACADDQGLGNDFFFFNLHQLHSRNSCLQVLIRNPNITIQMFKF